MRKAIKTPALSIASYSLFVFIGLAYGGTQRITPIVPPPQDVIFRKDLSGVYTRVIKSRRFGKFYFTPEAENGLFEGKRLCRILGIRKEITNFVKASRINKNQIQIQWRSPPDEIYYTLVVNIPSVYYRGKNDIREGLSQRGEEWGKRPKTHIKWEIDKLGNIHILADYLNKNYIIKAIIRPGKNQHILLAEYIIKYSMEMPMVGLLNKQQEIRKLILPPEENILLLNLNINLIRECNKENTSLIKNIDNPALKPDQKDDIVLHFIANAIYHPLGGFSLRIKGRKIILVAEVSSQRMLIPLECLSIPLNKIIQKEALKEFFPGKLISTISDAGIIEAIRKRNLPLRRDWYVISTPNSCLWTEYFMNYIENKKKLAAAEEMLEVPIHLHPWYSLQWLLDDPFGRYWITQYRIHLTPSNKDISFFRGRYPESKIYIILSKDIYSDEFDWAIYDDLAAVENVLKELDNFERDYHSGHLSGENIKRLQGIFKKLEKCQLPIENYHRGKGQKLAIEPGIDKLIKINMRQAAISSLIGEYKNQYPWRLDNFSLTIPLLNRYLDEKGWKCIKTKKRLGIDIAEKTFYYNPALTTSMDLSLFIMFELCYIDAKNLQSGAEMESTLVGILKDTIHQLNYLAVKYHHLKGFSEHVRYLSYVIRYYVWESEKDDLIAREQIRRGRIFLDKYNLGYYTKVSIDKLKTISGIHIKTDSKRIMGLESIVKKLSGIPSIKHEEDFITGFEKKLVSGILNALSQ